MNVDWDYCPRTDTACVRVNKCGLVVSDIITRFYRDGIPESKLAEMTEILGHRLRVLIGNAS